jgi:transketolase
MKQQLSKNQKTIRHRLLEMLYKAGVSHIGSCISVIDIIDSVYAVKKKNEKFILSNGHAAAAWYVILEKYGFLTHPNIKKLGVHPTRNPKKGIDVSTGSLGQGLPIAVGMAIANRKKTVYCLISDGECAEGSMWESFRIIHEFGINNIKILLSANGWGAYGSINPKALKKRIQGFGLRVIEIDGYDTQKIVKSLKTPTPTPTVLFVHTHSDQLPFLKGLDAHYYTMTDADIREAKKLLQ